MKIAFLVGSPAISGGTYVIFEHATRNKTRDNDVYIITENKVKKEDILWHPEAKKLKYLTYNEASKIEFDIVVATWWKTVYEAYRIKAKKYIYFVQSIESKFYPKSEKNLVWLAEATYLLPLDIITEATWIKEYLEKSYNRNVKLVHNGIRKDIYTLDGETYDKCNGLRVLIEGPIDASFKNVPKTVSLALESKADEIWLLTSSDLKQYKGVDRVFSKVPITDVAKIYRSCDVIVKLSYVEGMFGPPLEMFHCGGTAITYDVTGYNEYLINEYNSFVVKTDDDDRVIQRINELKENKKLLEKLKLNAIKTAEKWIGWPESSKRFGQTLKELSKNSSLTQDSLEKQTKLLFNGYRNFEEKEISIKQALVTLARNRTPKLYELYRKIKKIFKK